MLALPVARFAVGVNVAVLTRPVPLKSPRVPPVVTISVATKLAPGSALKVKVIVAVSPAFNALELLVIVTVGVAAPSIVTANNISANQQHSSMST
jgi:hypothetical protein